MNKKVTLVSTIVGLAGIGGTGVLIATKNNLNSSVSSSAGGALSSLTSSDSYFSNSGDLRVKGSTTDSLGLEMKGQLGEINLSPEDLEGLLKMLLTGDEISTDKSKSSVSTIQGEIIREGSVAGIKGTVDRNYQLGTRGKNLQQQFADLQSAFQKIKQWEEKGGLNQQKKGPSNSKEIPDLTKKERIALKTFFIAYGSLAQKRPLLYSQLQKASSGFSDLSTWKSLQNNQKDMPLLPKVQKALDDIQWDRAAITIKKGQSRIRRVGSRSSIINKQNSYGWGTWDKNPYKNFFKDEIEFQKAMDSMDNSQQALEEYLSSKRAEGLFATFLGPEMVKSVYSDMDKYLNAVGDTQSSVELQVGKKLMTWMGR